MTGSEKYKAELITGEQWQRFFNEAENPVPFSTDEWSASLCNVYALACDKVALLKDGNVVAGILVYYTFRHGRKFVSHPPLTPYNSIIYKKAISPVDISGAEQFIKACNVLSGYLKQQYVYPYFLTDTSIRDVRSFQWSGWSAAPGFTYIVNPSVAAPDADVIRRARKCREEGFYIKNDFDPEAFWTLYNATAQRQGIKNTISSKQMQVLLTGIAQFTKMSSAFDSKNTLHACWVQMKCNNNVVYNWNAASDPALLKLGGTPFLVMNMLDEFKKDGIGLWDLCGADIPSIAKFKGSLGGDLIPYFKLSYSRYSFLQKVKNRIQLKF